MLKIHTWDEICGEWSTFDLNLPSDTRDPNLINQTFEEHLNADDNYTKPDSNYTVAHHATAGPILTIECRDERGHLAILIVNGEEQE